MFRPIAPSTQHILRVPCYLDVYYFYPVTRLIPHSPSCCYSKNNTKKIEEVEAVVDEVVHELEEEEEAMEEERLGLQDIMRAQMEEMKKKIKLPIDLILGNPALVRL